MSVHVEIAGMVRPRFRTALEATGSTLVIVPDNAPQPTVPPAGGWVRLAIQFGQRFAPDLGSTHWITPGVALAQFFWPLGRGDGELLALLDDLADSFDGVTLPGPPSVAFQPTYISAPPIVERAAWSLVWAIPFRGEEYTS